eukprot:2163074-Rhodomonas_salina.2
MRLVMVYKEDRNFFGGSAGNDNDLENQNRTVRTDPDNNMCYVQVTFTLGAQYEPIESGLIPLDSVRAGKGTFFSDVDTADPTADGDMTHVCAAYTTPG